MAESLPAHQIEKVLELGAWRDEGRRFAVGLHGEVFKHEDDKEYPDERRQWQGAASASSAPPPSSAAPAEANSESTGELGSAALRTRYANYLAQTREYYPSLLAREVEDGLWVIVQSFPLGRDGPRFWICLFLPYTTRVDPKAFAFWKVAPLPRPVGPRHTNYPDASICAFIPENDAWRPGDSPLKLLNLYADWIICHLYLELEHRWPGRQFGSDAAYRIAEFRPEEWCFCESRKRYSECHMQADQIEVDELREVGILPDYGPRKVPQSILCFAKSSWRRIPRSRDLNFHDYKGLPPRRFTNL